MKDGGHLVAIAFALATMLTSATVALAQSKPQPNRPGGFWKCKTDSGVKGEFNGEDPVGLASGKHIPTDCAIHWSDHRGKIYCFSSLPSLNFFDSELGLLQKAQAFWDKEHGGTSRR